MTTLHPAFTTERIATRLREAEPAVRPSHRAGAFDALAVYCPFVFSVDGRQGMTYVGWDGTGYQTALTWKGHDGWGDGHVVLPRNPASELRRYNAAMTSIVREN